MRYLDVAVVGGGVAGLIAAHDSSRLGLDTMLFESAPALGGRSQTRVQEGFHFNLGPHAIYTNGQFCKTLNSLAAEVSLHRLRLTGAIALWKGERHPLAVSPDVIQCAAPFDDLDRPQLIKTLEEVAQGAYDYAGQPLTAFTQRLRPRVASVIESLVRVATYVHAPELIDGKAALDQLKVAFGGVNYVDGGWGDIVAALAASATVAGAKLQTRSSITKVARSASGWVLSGPGLEDQRASSVILAVAPQVAATLVKESPILATAVQNTKPAKLMCLDLGLSKLPRPDATFALEMDQPTYFSVHSTAARLAPSEGAMVHVARYLAPDETPSNMHFGELERLTDALQPGWRDVEVHRQRLAGMIVAHDFPRFQRRGQRSPVTVDDAPGLFLAGDWVGAEGMLADASAASARAAARAAAEYNKQKASNAA
jgi:phytoene dehydrogenase-like protein